jgi:hypothetical protein
MTVAQLACYGNYITVLIPPALCSSYLAPRAFDQRFFYPSGSTRAGDNKPLNSIGMLEGKIPLERPWRRWEDNIIMDLKEVV